MLISCSKKEIPATDEGVNLSKAMGDAGDPEFSKAVDKRKFSFPEDHGQHPDFRTEWWYFTGNLTSDNGKKFGYQFTIFRTALSKVKQERHSGWNSNQIYMAHFAVTDIDGQKFYYDERFSREGNSLAGAQAYPLRVWLDNWEMIQAGSEVNFNLPQMKLVAGTKDVKIELTVEAAKPYVLQGDSGLSRKGRQEGNSSYYYSYTNLITNGTIAAEGKRYNVSGKSWLDREWSTSALSPDQAGWDWFALQLNDSSELMYYQMRKSDGTPDEFSKGIFVTKEGNTVPLIKKDVTLEVRNHWTSKSGVEYPSGWKLSIPKLNIDLDISPAVKNQLLDVTVKYWEGSVTVSGRSSGKDVEGRGYAELTGY